MTLAPDNEDQKLSEVYVQRNEAVVALAAMALRAGFNAGRGVDESKVEGWDHVVYVDLPDGKQVSWHMSPSCIRLLDILPVYPGKWDGKFTGREMGWSQSIPYHPGLGAAGDTRESALRREHRRDAAERTLTEKGYTHGGGMLWKPPIGITGLLGKSLSERQQEHVDQNRGRAAVTTLTDMGFEWLGGATWRFKEFHKDTSDKLSVRLSDDELILLAKQAAVECPVQRNYMPKSMSTAWAPHQWVIDAMRLAMHKSPGRAIADNRLALVLQHLLHPNCGLAPDLVTQVEKALAAFRNEAEFHVEPPKGEAPSLNETRITRTKELIDFAVLGLERGCSKADAYAAMLAGIRDTLERTEF